MNLYEEMLAELSEDLIIDDKAILPETMKGFYTHTTNNEKVILLRKDLNTSAEFACTLVEEVAHHYITAGDITDQSKIENRKQEYKARRWAVKKLIRIEDLVEAHKTGITSRFELADYLNVTEEFLDMALDHFKSIYGQAHAMGEYIVYFEPLGILRKFVEK